MIKKCLEQLASPNNKFVISSESPFHFEKWFFHVNYSRVLLIFRQQTLGRRRLWKILIHHFSICNKITNSNQFEEDCRPKLYCVAWFADSNNSLSFHSLAMRLVHFTCGCWTIEFMRFHFDPYSEIHQFIWVVYHFYGFLVGIICADEPILWIECELLVVGGFSNICYRFDRNFNLHWREIFYAHWCIYKSLGLTDNNFLLHSGL